MQSKWVASMEWRWSRTECVKDSPASVDIMAEIVIWKYITPRWWAVGYKFLFIIDLIAGSINGLARYITFRHVRANSARLILGSTWSLRRVSICQKDNQYVQIMMKTHLHGSKGGMDNTLKWLSTEPQQFVVLSVLLQTVIRSLLGIPDILAAVINKRDTNMVTAPFWEWASTEGQSILALYFG